MRSPRFLSSFRPPGYIMMLALASFVLAASVAIAAPQKSDEVAAVSPPQSTQGGQPEVGTAPTALFIMAIELKGGHNQALQAIDGTGQQFTTTTIEQGKSCTHDEEVAATANCSRQMSDTSSTGWRDWQQANANTDMNRAIPTNATDNKATWWRDWQQVANK